jgi:antitoxin component YwqK of YwqJK toxin-antitoxin module
MIMKLVLLILGFFILFSCNIDCTKEYSHNHDGYILKSKDYYPDCSDTSNYFHRAYYENGTLAHEIEIKDNIFHGEYKSFDRNGKIEKIGGYINGERTGLWKIWFDDSCYQEKYYENNELNGSFYEKLDNKYFSFGQFVNGKEDGEWKWLYSDSSLDYIAEYENGKLYGTVKDYHKNGTLIALIEFREDTIFDFKKAFDSEGNLTLENGNGFCIKYDEDKIIDTIYYQNGKKIK